MPAYHYQHKSLARQNITTDITFRAWPRLPSPPRLDSIAQLAGYTRKHQTPKACTKNIVSVLTFLRIHLVTSSSSAFAATPTATSTSAATLTPLLVEILHFSDCYPLCITNSLHVYHCLILVDDFFRNLLAERVFNA